MEDTDLSPEIKEAQERIAKARAELEQNNSVESTPESKAPVADPQSESAPAPISSEFAELQRKYAELVKEQSRRDGMYGSELDKLRKSLQVTADQNAVLMKRFEEKPVVAEEPKDEDWEVRRHRYIKDVPVEVRNEYEDSSLDAMARISEKAAREVFKAELERFRKTLPTINAETPKEVAPELVERLDKMERSSAYSEFAAAVDQLAPGFAKANGNEYLKIPADPNWIKFLEGPKDEYETWQQYCERIGGPRVAATAFQQFKKASTASAEPSAGVAGQVSPTKSQASSNVSDKANRVYSQAEYEKFKEDLNRGAYDDDRTKAIEIMELYKQAAIEGRLK